MTSRRYAALAAAGLTWAAVLGFGGVRAWRNPSMRPPRLPTHRPPTWAIPSAGAALAAAVPAAAVVAERTDGWKRRVAVSGLILAAVPGSLVPAFEAYRRSTRASDVRTAGTVLVLGCGIRGATPTAVLRQRLSTAMYIAGEGTEILVSGGLGAGETATEASVMAAWLRERGVEDVRLEGRSTSTDQNLDFSRELVRSEPVTVVTSDFHVFRVRAMLRSRDLVWQVVGAPTPIGYWATSVLREFLALMVINPVIVVAVAAGWTAVGFAGDNAISRS